MDGNVNQTCPGCEGADAASASVSGTESQPIKKNVVGHSGLLLAGAAWMLCLAVFAVEIIAWWLHVLMRSAEQSAEGHWLNLTIIVMGSGSLAFAAAGLICSIIGACRSYVERRQANIGLTLSIIYILLLFVAVVLQPRLF